MHCTKATSIRYKQYHSYILSRINTLYQSYVLFRIQCTSDNLHIIQCTGATSHSEQNVPVTSCTKLPNSTRNTSCSEHTLYQRHILYNVNTVLGTSCSELTYCTSHILYIISKLYLSYIFSRTHNLSVTSCTQVTNCTRTTSCSENTITEHYLMYQGYILYRTQACAHAQNQSHMLFIIYKLFYSQILYTRHHTHIFFTCAMTEMAFQEQKKQDLLEWSLSHYQLAVQSSLRQSRM
jgi:hypothetical protein